MYSTGRGGRLEARAGSIVPGTRVPSGPGARAVGMRVNATDTEEVHGVDASQYLTCPAPMSELAYVNKISPACA